MKKWMALVLCVSLCGTMLLGSGLSASAARLFGDIDLDGAVTTVDARMALTGTVGNGLTDRQKKLADMDASQSVTSGDARMVLVRTVSTEHPTTVLDGNKLVTFGDSLTAGGTWPNTLAGAMNMYLFNGAMGGCTSDQGLLRFDQFVGNRNPDFVTLSFGMNDLLMTAKNTPKVSLEQFRKNIELMAAKVLQLNATPILMTVSYLNEDIFYSAQAQDPAHYTDVGGPLAWLDQYNAVVRSVAQTFNYDLVDIRAECDKYNQTEFLKSDGIHLSALGNQVYADTIQSVMESAYTRDHNVPPIGDPMQTKKSPAGVWTEEIISHKGADWYTFPSSGMNFITNGDNSLAISNTTGLWPAGDYSLPMPYVVPVNGSKLMFDFTTANVNTSIVVFFGGASPSVYQENQYVKINTLLGAETNSVDDITGNQTVTGSINLSDMGLPSGAYDKNGNVVISGVKIYAAGTAGQPVTFRQLAVYSTGAPA